MTKEMVLIIVSCAVWGIRSSIQFECHNSSAVAAITKGSANNDLCMHLRITTMHIIWFFAAYYNNININIYIPVIQFQDIQTALQTIFQGIR